MPKKKSMGGLPPLRFPSPSIYHEDVNRAAKAAEYELNSRGSDTTTLVAKLQAEVLIGELVGSLVSPREFENFVSTGLKMLSVLPDFRYQPHSTLTIDPRGYSISAPKGEPLAPTEFILRDLVFSSVLVAKDGLAEMKLRPSKAVLWDSWINALSQVLTFTGNNTASSHHAKIRKHDKESPFVRFVYELERGLYEKISLSGLPSEFLKHLPPLRSKSSLAKAISRARKGKVKSRQFIDAYDEWRKVNPYLETAIHYVQPRTRK